VPTPITAIGTITGTVKVGSVLTVGALTPAGATADYNWQIATSSSGPWADLGALTNTYTITVADAAKFIRVLATGNGNYSGFGYERSDNGSSDAYLLR